MNHETYLTPTGTSADFRALVRNENEAKIVACWDSGALHRIPIMF